ncbi:SirB1 family protein [Rhodopila sp.]|jgi:regulator of sirC expression with transglutaminase-like and TPR domain|uniref:SirB1 family protein n=1 Tax=Rhodopila sp. TaxID=2480087 RepID=UPI002B8EE319|nr:transglutaminase-like domain-containing protein [Rhodopila sp.]HVZ10738.1 transglutaminase-like domain-containing protein [Rhodopila sp.]
MSDPRRALEAIGQLPDVEIDIGSAALQLARVDAPDADWLAAERHLSDLARDAVDLARAFAGADVHERAAALAGLLVDSYGYRGDTDTYDDLANANLIRVIERRRGLPVALGVLWLHTTRCAGWRCHGVDFPAHFLIALQETGQQAVLDVFGGGQVLGSKELRALLRRVEGPDAVLRPGLLVPMNTRRVLLRLQNNIMTRRLQAGDIEGGLGCTEDMLLIAPDQAELWRQAGLLNQKLHRVAAAAGSYRRFLELVPKGATADAVRAQLDILKTMLN